MFANFVVIVIWILSHRPGRESKLLKNPLSESNLAGGIFILDQGGSLILVQGGKFAWRTGSTRTGFSNKFDKPKILQMVNALESKSTHPAATAIHQYAGEPNHSIVLENPEEIAGHELKASVSGKELLVGNFKLMDKFGINYGIDPAGIVYTSIAIAYDGEFVGYLTLLQRYSRRSFSFLWLRCKLRSFVSIGHTYADEFV